MYKVELYVRVRRACMVEGMSTREAARVFGLHRDTVRKMLEYSVPPGYRRQSPPRRPKLDPYHGVIDRILEEDRRLPRKQRHTAKRIYDRLRAEHGFGGKYTIVKDYVRERRLRTREMYVPLSHPPGDAQCDFGQAKAVIGGVEQTIHYFVLDLPHSDACFVKAYPAETTEAFCDGHVSAFSFLGGVPRSIVYDNTRLAVAKIMGDGRRQRTRVFSELQSHYLFDDRFGRPGKGNDKGKVEGLVGYARRNFLVPVPSFPSFDALNIYLEERCLERLGRQLRGHRETIGQRMERRMGVAGGVRSAAAAAGVEDGQARQAGVRAGAAVDGELPQGGGVRIRARCPQARRHKLRRHQAPGAVQDGGSTSETRPGAVPLPAQGHRDEDSSQRLHGAHVGERAVSDRSTVLLEHHLKELKLPTFLREYGRVAGQCAAEDVDHPGYLLRLSELELIDRHHRMVDRRIKAARFPATKSLDTFDFLAMPSVNKHLVMQLARCEYVDRRENVIAIGNSGTGKTHVALGLGLAACQRGLSVGFTTAASLVHELIEARDERRLLNLQKKLARLKLLIVDELGFVPLSKTGAELLFEVFSQRYERGSVLVTTNLPFDEWTEVFGSERLTGALLDRLTHRVHILEMNGESYRLRQSRHTTAMHSAAGPPEA